MLSENAKTLKGKVIAGYQGWFGTVDDGLGRAWMHWNRDEPRIEDGEVHVSFEMYPDISEYPADQLTDIGFDAFPDGRKAQLFSSYHYDTVDLHFSWMRDYGIDGIALQRFLGEALGSRSEHLNTVAESAKTAAEKYDRVFYVCYDFTGANNDDYVQSIKDDFSYTVMKELKLLDSPNYLHNNGKPVVQLWGMGVNGNYRRGAEEALEVVNYFRDLGCYVIGGTPTDWRIDSGDGIPGFKDVYAAYDMVSPWTVGRFGSAAEAVNHYKNKILPDMEYCIQQDKDYMPVVFSGFAWSLWNGGKPNQIPRKEGELLKAQLKEAMRLNPEAVYVAMFDEYDEGTAIMKAADSSFAIPSNSYFLTNSADGSYVSSDYYLRLIGEFTRQFRGESGADIDAVPLTAGPIWYRSGFEKGIDATVSSKTESIYSLTIEDTTQPDHKYAIRVKGEPPAENTDIATLTQINAPIKDTTTLAYEVSGSGEVYIDVIFTDGTRLSSTAGIITPTSDEWYKITQNLGEQAKGKTMQELTISILGGIYDTDVWVDNVVLQD